MATRATDRPLRIAGIDVQPIGRNKGERPVYLAAAAGRAGIDAGEIRALDERFLEVYARPSRERRAVWRGEGGAEFLAAYEALAERLEAAGEAEAGRVAASLAAYLRQERATTMVARVEARDQAMAANVRYLAEVAYPAEKIILWAHNFHIREANEHIVPHPEMFVTEPARTMGHWLAREFGDTLFSVGFYALEGQARSNGGAIFAIPTAAEGSLESGLASLDDSPLIWLSESSDFLHGEFPARHDGRHPMMMDWRQQYDALVLVRSARPSGSFYDN